MRRQHEDHCVLAALIEPHWAAAQLAVRPLATLYSQTILQGTTMKIALVICAITVWAASVPAATPSATPAESAALVWLALVDAGNYDQSWSSASSLFRQKISEAHWQSAASSTRVPPGVLKSRTLRSATLQSALPGAPDGQYVVIQFDSSFEHKASAVETVTPVLDADGKWHVSGYYIK